LKISHDELQFNRVVLASSPYFFIFIICYLKYGTKHFSFHFLHYNLLSTLNTYFYKKFKSQFLHYFESQLLQKKFKSQIAYGLLFGSSF